MASFSAFREKTGGWQFGEEGKERGKKGNAERGGTEECGDQVLMALRL